MTLIRQKQNSFIAFVLMPLFWSYFSPMSYADVGSWRCGSQLVSLGDGQSEVEEICGPPTFIDSQQVERTVKTYYKGRPDNSRKTQESIPNDNDVEGGYSFSEAQTFVSHIDEWTYNPGSSSFIRTLRFEDDALVSIKEGSYGFNHPSDRESTPKIGDSKAVVWMKYGPTNQIRKNTSYNVHVDRRRNGNYLYVEKISTPLDQEEWIYDRGSNKFLQKLTFRNNRLVDIKTLSRRGKDAQ